VRLKVPGIAKRLAQQVVDFVQAIRQQELYKLPGVAEPWTGLKDLGHLNQTELDPATVEATLGIILKYQDDIDKIKGNVVSELVAQVVA
jgi:hypothetical protein